MQCSDLGNGGAERTMDKQMLRMLRHIETVVHIAYSSVSDYLLLILWGCYYLRYFENDLRNYDLHCYFFVYL